MIELQVRKGGAFTVCKREYESMYPGEIYDVRNMFVGERPLLGCAIGGKLDKPIIKRAPTWCSKRMKEAARKGDACHEFVVRPVHKRFGIIVYTVGLPNSAAIREHEIAHLNGWPAHHPR